MPTSAAYNMHVHNYVGYSWNYTWTLLRCGSHIPGKTANSLRDQETGARYQFNGLGTPAAASPVEETRYARSGRSGPSNSNTGKAVFFPQRRVLPGSSSCSSRLFSGSCRGDPSQGSAAGIMGQQSLIYGFVARGTVVLVSFTEFTGNFSSIAAQCLQKLPASNNKFTYTCDGHTFNYLVEEGYSCVSPRRIFLS